MRTEAQIRAEIKKLEQEIKELPFQKIKNILVGTKMYKDITIECIKESKTKNGEVIQIYFTRTEISGNDVHAEISRPLYKLGYLIYVANPTYMWLEEI